MMNKLFPIALALFFIGCDSITSEEETCDYCYMQIEAPALPMDSNGFYHLVVDSNSIQTFTQLRAYIGYEYEYVGWTTDTYFQGCIWGECEDVPIVNGAGYSSSDGYAYQMLGVYPENIGDSATIWAGYYDNYGNQWLDSIKVIID